MLPVSPDFIEYAQSAAFSGDDIISGFAPDEGFELCAMMEQVIVDGGLEVVRA